jgi:hypothetical protein
VFVLQYPKTITVLYFCTTFSQIQFSCLFLASLYSLPSPGQVTFFCLTICQEIHSHSFSTVMFKVSSFILMICFRRGRRDSNPTDLPLLPHLLKSNAALVFHHFNSSFLTYEHLPDVATTLLSVHIPFQTICSSYFQHLYNQ